MGFAGVVETVLRMVARISDMMDDPGIMAQVHRTLFHDHAFNSMGMQPLSVCGHACLQTPLLAHAMLHHPHAWPSQETALGLLISLRKAYQTMRVRPCLLSFTRHLRRCCCQPTAW